MQRRGIRIEPQRLAIGLDSFGRAVESQQHKTQIGMEHGIVRHAFDGAANQPLGNLGPARLMMHHGQRMAGISVARIGRQHLLIGDSGFLQLPFPMQVEAPAIGLGERIGRRQ